MADFVFNVALGRVRTYYDNVDGNSPANSALVVVLLKASGLEADGTLRDHDDLAALLAAANDEADFTNYARKTIADASTAASAHDDTNNRLDLDVPDLTWSNAGGASNNTLGKLLVCYDPDTTGGTDSSVVPLTAHDFSATTDGTNLVAVIAASGFYRAS